MKKIKNILWDFDGVILDSMSVRDWGFREIFKKYDKADIEQLIVFHRKNGGLSRYVKIRFFYENILKREITEKQVNEYASEFSKLMKTRLTDKSNLITDALQFIEENRVKYKFHIVSGSDHIELNYLCKALEINHFFLTIDGSPTPKNVLVKNLLNQKEYREDDTCLIGDSLNDLEAADANKILFFGYNNNDLKEKSPNYIDSFKDFLIT